MLFNKIINNMAEDFKTWSEINPKALEKINPKIGLREWDELTNDEKDKIFRYFYNKKWFHNDYENIVFHSIRNLNDLYKKQSFGIKTLEHNGPHYSCGSLDSCCYDNASEDFLSIFRIQNQDVVYELLTLYAWQMIDFGILRRLNDAENEEIRKDEINRAYNCYNNSFDKFALCFNDIFGQFGINVMLTRSGLIPRQDEKITKEIYEPVLMFLSDLKWESVNRDLKDAFKDYQLKTDKAYSSCVTHTISALQAFLQLIVNGKTGKGDISALIIEARKKKIIPDDKFTEQIFKNIESILMYERQATADAHPKKEYATEKNARLVLNLVMVFLQHCIQN
jgi:hypothetical protein